MLQGFSVPLSPLGKANLAPIGTRAGFRYELAYTVTDLRTLS